MNAPKHARRYDIELDQIRAACVDVFRDEAGNRPAWAIGKHEKKPDPFFPLDLDWVRRT